MGLPFPNEPEEFLLIETIGLSMSGQPDVRTYGLHRPSYKNGYRSRVSGGQECWTDQPWGLNGEPITEHRKWVLVSADGYIGSFPRWEGPYGVREFFVSFLRREITEVMGE